MGAGNRSFRIMFPLVLTFSRRESRELSAFGTLLFIIAEEFPFMLAWRDGEILNYSAILALMLQFPKLFPRMGAWRGSKSHIADKTILSPIVLDFTQLTMFTGERKNTHYLTPNLLRVIDLDSKQLAIVCEFDYRTGECNPIKLVCIQTELSSEVGDGGVIS